MFKQLSAAFFLIILMFSPISSKAEISLDVSVDLLSPPPVAIAPPPLPVYVVPEPPEEDLVWTPGHWLWSDYGYYWVPGTWVEAPEVGYLWTPGYWGYDEDAFLWHEGYWGPHVGYYGGINYGGGYGGEGFNGGGWQHGSYVVDRSVTNVTINNYNRNTTSFNGGPGGINTRPSAQEQSFARENHIQPTTAQVQHIQAASSNPQLRESVNNGRPAIAATSRPGEFSGHGVVAARQAGVANPQAEKYNQQIRSNPTLAKNAAMPRVVSTPNSVTHTPAIQQRTSGETNLERENAQPRRATYQPTYKPVVVQPTPASRNPAPVNIERENAEPRRAPAQPAYRPAPEHEPERRAEPPHEETKPGQRE